MHKRERLEHTLAGEVTDRPPVTAWRHFPGDDQRSLDLARAVLHFQNTFDWDVAVVQPANSYLVTDYGAGDEWDGSADGTRIFLRRVIQRTLDWTALRPLDPTRGSCGRVAEAIRIVAEALADTVPIIVTIFSPLAQAADLTGNASLTRQIRTQSDRVQSGLNTLTESTLRWLDALRRLPIAGVLYITPADYAMYSDAEYAEFGLPYDRKIIDALPSKFWFNMISLSGEQPIFKYASVFKVHAVHWHDRAGEPTLAVGKSLFGGAACGGVAAHDMALAAPNTLRDAARDAILQMNARRLLLAPGAAVPVTTPLSNFRALRDAVERSA